MTSNGTCVPFMVVKDDYFLLFYLPLFKHNNPYCKFLLEIYRGNCCMEIIIDQIVKLEVVPTDVKKINKWYSKCLR